MLPRLVAHFTSKNNENNSAFLLFTDELYYFDLIRKHATEPFLAPSELKDHPMLRLKQVLLLILTGFVAGRTYELFSIPSFKVSVSVQPPDSTKSTDPIQLGNKIKSVAKQHLFVAFEEMLYGVGFSGGAHSPIGQIKLDAIVYDERKGSGSGENFGADMIGNVTFDKESLEGIDDFEIDQSTVRMMVKTAFEGAAGTTEFLELLQEISNIVTVQVETDMDNKSTNNISHEKTITTVYGDENVPVIKTKGGGTYALVLSMAGAVGVLVLGMFVYVKKDQNHHKHGHLLMNVDEYSDFSDEDYNDRFIGELQLDEEISYESGDGEEGLQFIPVPARIDDEKCKVIKNYKKV